ncbi:hypothetical protein ACS77_12835 [Pseudomonas syringae]|uniref:Glycosyltransferase n=1 Tax=Pseudomonas syringae TaxID=317 RepID=A0A0L1MFL5_PSESX|nr:hypothetical protein ACS77_12835 [Pseudomonas syringae]
MKSLMIAWVGYQRRADTMKQYWAYDILHLPNRFKKKYTRPFDYLIKSFKTIKALFVGKPEVVWVQLPPSPVLHIALAYKFFVNRRLKIIADAHNSLLRKQWITFPGTVSLLNKIDAVVVHNFKVKEELSHAGVNAENIFILEDLPCDFKASPASDHQTPYVLFPCSFDIDEPIEVVINAAREMPHINFLITGKHEGKLSEALIESMPANIKLTGFLSKLIFEQLLCNANVVLGLTTRDNVQLSVANEAVSAGRPMALSNTTVLRSLFSDAAVFVETLDPQSIKFGVSQLIENEELYKEKSALLKAKRIKRWKGQAELLRTAVII